MRVTIKTREEGGLNPRKKSYYVDCTVLFSEEEKAIIQSRGLGQHYIAVGAEVAPPAPSSQTLSTLLRALSPFVFLTGCVAGAGMEMAGNRAGDSVFAFTFFAALAMYFGGVALKRHIRIAAQPQQHITMQRLLLNPSFSVYAFDNATAKTIDVEVREALTRLKDGLLANARIAQPETFEI